MIINFSFFFWTLKAPLQHCEYVERSRRQHMDAGSSIKIESIEIINKKTLVQETPLFKTAAF